MCCKSKEHLRITKVLFLTKILILLIFVSSSFGGTVGITTIFGSTSTSSNRRAMPFTMTEDGVITSISMYHVGGSGDMILGVYDDNGGLPNNQLGVTLSTGVNGTAGFQTINLISPALVSSGQTIWLAWAYQSIPGIAYETGSPGRADAGEGWSGGMPDPYGSSTTANYIYSIYATYTTNQFPTAVISANPTSGNPPLTVNLDATGSSDPDSDPLTYDWQFGDGGSSTSAITSHEYTSAGIYTVTLTVDDGNGGTDVATTKIYVGVTVLFEADFNSDAQGFTYADDAFRGTSQPSYTSGAYTASGGNGGSGGVEVTLGAPSSQVNNMSGGWSYTFNLAQAGDVELSLMYNLTQSPTYESDEQSQSLVSIDGTLYGTPPNDYIAQIQGDGQGAGEPPITTGWQSFTTTIPSLSAGNHTITVGGFNNKATLSDEYTTIVMDDIVLTGVSGPDDREIDSLALVALYNSTDGPNWTNNTNWLTNQPIDTWFGIKIENNRVDSLNLEGNQLSGNIPPELGNLTKLQFLIVGNNSLSGPIPPEIGNLTFLSNLYFQKNDLSGTIPTELFNLVNLQILFLASNGFIGTIPAEIGNLVNLKQLHLYFNQFTGLIPPEIGNLTSIEIFGISENQFSGNIPSTIGNLTNCTLLMLQSNQFTDLPNEIVNLTLSASSDISANKFCTLTPEVETWANSFDTDWASTQNCPPPQIQITANPQSGDVPLTVNFTATNIGQSNIDTWSWVFGDGGTSTEQNPTYVYNTTGTFNAQVTATGIGGSTTESVNITVNALPPEIGITATPQSGPAPLTVSFTATNTGGPVDTWSWTFGDGGTSTEQNPIYTYVASGLYNAQVTATGPGGSDVKLIPIDVIDDPRKIDSLALVALYNSTDGANWTNNTNWLTTELIDTWFGITVSGNRVTRVDLPSNNLNGPIPPEIGNLINLTHLEMFSNNLSGSIPGEIGNLINLTNLTVHNNQLNGPLPIELGNLGNLSQLRLHHNQLTGTIPPELGNLINCINFELNNNQLSGAIPSNLGNLINVQNIVLSENQLTGSIPPELGDLASLQNLYLQVNQLTGSIPSELGNLTNLLRLYLIDNSLTGQIPSELGNLSNLIIMFLARNNLTGEIPASLGNLTNVVSMWLQGNSLSGQIPPSFGNLISLSTLFLARNDLSSGIPGTMGNLSNLEYLDLASNSLSGEIPPELGNLSSIKTFALQSNNLYGPVPPELGNLNTCEVFFLGFNQLTDLPEEVTNLTNLTAVNLENNQFCNLSPVVVSWANTHDPDWATTQDCPPPEIEITATPQSGLVPLSVNFTATNMGQSNIDTWSWNFGDGGTSTEQNPAYIYNTAGTFNAQVTATGIGGSTTESIVITPFGPPVVNITANPQSGEAPLTVTFTVNNTGGPVETWDWDFGDGTNSNVQNPPPHTYTSVGTYNVVLTATNAAGTSTDNVTVNVVPATAILTMTIAGQGTTSPPVGQTQVVQGEDVPISATPAIGYEFVGWNVTAGSATIADPAQSSTTAQLSGDATINANFALLEYTLTVTSGPNGTTVPSGAVPAQHGIPIAVIATPDQGYKFSLWSVVNGTATIANPASANTNVTLESGDAEILATFIVDDDYVPYNRMLSIAGTLYDENGDPVGYPDPVDIDVSVRLATDITAGEIVYTETFYVEDVEAVTVDNGLFVARLGSGTSADDLQAVLSAYENLFVEITVEEQDPPDVLLPRTPLTAVPFTLTGPPAAISELNLNTIHGGGDPNDAGIQGRVGMYYIDDETGMTWLRVSSKWILLE